MVVLAYIPLYHTTETEEKFISDVNLKKVEFENEYLIVRVMYYTNTIINSICDYIKHTNTTEMSISMVGGVYGMENFIKSISSIRSLRYLCIKDAYSKMDGFSFKSLLNLKYIKSFCIHARYEEDKIGRASCRERICR